MPNMTDVEEDQVQKLVIYKDKEYKITKTPREVRTSLANAFSKANRELNSRDYQGYGRSQVRCKYMWEEVVAPHLKALLILGDTHDCNDDNMVWLFAELFVLITALSKVNYNVLKFEKIQTGKTVRESARFLGVTFEGHMPLINRFSKMGKTGGIWTILLLEQDVKELADTDPVAIINAVGEILHYAKSVSFSIKLDNHQLNILKSFFRTEV